MTNSFLLPFVVILWPHKTIKGMSKGTQELRNNFELAWSASGPAAAAPSRQAAAVSLAASPIPFAELADPSRELDKQ